MLVFGKFRFHIKTYFWGNDTILKISKDKNQKLFSIIVLLIIPRLLYKKILCSLEPH